MKVRRRTAALLALLLVVGTVASIGTTLLREPAAVPAPQVARGTPAPAKRPGRARVSASSRPVSGRGPAATFVGEPGSRDRWLDELIAACSGSEVQDSAALEALAEATRGRLPWRGLHEALRRVVEARSKAGSESAKRAADATANWLIGVAMNAYRDDRRSFAAAYRSAVVEDIDTDPSHPGASLVRRLRFREAAESMDALRAGLATWCYDDLARRAAERFRVDRVQWREWLRAARRDPDLTFAASWSDGVTAPTSAQLTALVRSKSFNGLRGPKAVALLLDLGEPELAAEVFGEIAGELAGMKGNIRDAAEQLTQPLEAELAAWRSLVRISPQGVPASAEGLDAWFATHRRSWIAHAIGTDGATELGVWDDDMTRGFLEGGLPWAPEQWEAVRERRAAAKEEWKDGIRGWTATSPGWAAFSDVSADFSARSTLVLEAAFGQALAALGAAPEPYLRKGARVFSHRRDYEEITGDHSRGHWVPGMNAVLTFLDDPSRTDFDDFDYPVLVHEATHAAISAAIGAAPEWFHEGMACYVQRWSPVASVGANEGHTFGTVGRSLSLRSARAAGLLPPPSELMHISGAWNVDDFGPVTQGRYAAAESLFVSLAEDPDTWECARSWFAAFSRGADPVASQTAEDVEKIDRRWLTFVDGVCCVPPSGR